MFLLGSKKDDPHNWFEVGLVKKVATGLQTFFGKTLGYGLYLLRLGIRDSSPSPKSMMALWVRFVGE